MDEAALKKFEVTEGLRSVMTPYQAAIDTNVLVAAARSRRGLSYRLLELFARDDARSQWNTSSALLLEYESVLKRPQHTMGRDVSVIERLLDDIAARANRQALFISSAHS